MKRKKNHWTYRQLVYRSWKKCASAANNIIAPRRARLVLVLGAWRKISELSPWLHYTWLKALGYIFVRFYSAKTLIKSTSWGLVLPAADFMKPCASCATFVFLLCRQTQLPSASQICCATCTIKFAQAKLRKVSWSRLLVFSSSSAYCAVTLPM